MKVLILFTAIIYFVISIPNSHAGIAGIITYLKGECNEPDKRGVKLCSSRENGDIYNSMDEPSEKDKDFLTVAMSEINLATVVIILIIIGLITLFCF